MYLECLSIKYIILFIISFVKWWMDGVFLCLGSAVIDRRCGVGLYVHTRVAPPALRSMGAVLADTATLPHYPDYSVLL